MNQAQALPRFTLYDQLLALPENQVGEIIGGRWRARWKPSSCATVVGCCSAPSGKTIRSISRPSRR